MRIAHIALATVATVLASPAVLAQSKGGPVPTPGYRADQPTSDRTPGKSTTTPLKEVTQTDDGRTSDRTPQGGPGERAGVPAGSGQGSSSTDSAQSSRLQGQQQSGTAGHGMQSTQSGRPTALTPDKLRQSLEKAGFSDVVILDQAYLVSGRTGDGDIVLMTINPPMASAAASSAISGSASSGSGSGSSGAGSTMPDASVPGPK